MKIYTNDVIMLPHEDAAVKISKSGLSTSLEQTHTWIGYDRVYDMRAVTARPHIFPYE
jgi:hypothetical protein